MMPYFQVGCYDVISDRKVLPSSECTSSVHPAPAAAARCCICNSVHRLPPSNSVYSFSSI